MSDLDFSDLVPIELPVKVRDKSYALKEATGLAATKYRNEMMSRTKLGPDGKASEFKGIADLEPMLVSLCLYETDADGKATAKNVSISTIQSWPSRIQKTLFNKIQEISDLLERSKERDLLENALSGPDAPLSMADLRSYVDALGDDYKPLKRWLGTVEESAKNERSGTTAGSV